jgi:hypothetical protein
MNIRKRRKIMDEIIDLAELLKTQQLLQHLMAQPGGIGEAGMKENLLHVIVETVEALQETNFKPWKAVGKEVNRQALAMELTDILQFWANAALAMGFTAQELSDALRRKWSINYERINNGEVTRTCDPT